MKSVDVIFLTDGSSDQCLIPLIEWLIEENHEELSARIKWADMSVLPRPPKTLSERMRCCLTIYRGDLLFVHRDAEGTTRQDRVDEIRNAASEAEIEQFVCVVPVRMTEAWLLFDESAIRKAAGNPNGQAELDLPRTTEFESVPNPKEILYGALKTASGRKGRRLAQFRQNKAVHQISRYISDYSALRVLPAFRELENEIGNLPLQNL